MYGLSEIFLWVRIANAPEMWQTWYVTVTFVCYLMAVLLKNSYVNLQIKKTLKKTLLISLFVDAIFAYIGVQISCIIQFFIGFYLAEDDCDGQLKSQVIVSALMMFLVVAIRILSHSLIENTVLYCRIIAPWTENVICIFVFVFFKYISLKHEQSIFKIANIKACITLDKLSYAVFIVHMAFLKNFYRYFDCLPGYIIDIIFLIYVFIASTFLEKLSSAILTKRREAKA